MLGIYYSGGPLSISKELAQMFKLEGVREVSVRRVDREEVGLDLVELRFKVRLSLGVSLGFRSRAVQSIPIFLALVCSCRCYCVPQSASHSLH